MALLLVSVGVITWQTWSKNDALAKQRDAMVTLMAVSNPELERAPHFTSLSLTMSGLKPDLERFDKDHDEFTRRLAFAARVETNRIARSRLGRMAHATTIEKFRPSEAGAIRKKLLSDAARTSSKYCRLVDNSEPIETDLFNLSIRESSEIRFSGFNEDEQHLLPISATFRDKITGDFVSIPDNAIELCASPDGRIAALSFEGTPVPRLYALDAVYEFNETSKKIGVSILELSSSWYPEVEVPQRHLSIFSVLINQQKMEYRVRSTFRMGFTMIQIMLL